MHGWVEYYFLYCYVVKTALITYKSRGNFIYSQVLVMREICLYYNLIMYLK